VNDTQRLLDIAARMHAAAMRNPTIDDVISFMDELMSVVGETPALATLAGLLSATRSNQSGVPSRSTGRGYRLL
jgi:hypothetical protein